MSFRSKPESAPISKTTVLSSESFECTLLPPVNSLSGTLVPKILHTGRRRRIVTIEVHRIQENKAVYEECVLRVLKRDRSYDHPNRSDASIAAMSVADEDDASAAHVSPEFLDEAPTTEYPGWKAKYKFPVSKISIKGTRKASVIIEINVGKRGQVRELVFEHADDSEDFQRALEAEISNDKERGYAKMKAAMGGEVIPMDATFTFLVEIVSGWDLPAADFLSSDPFVSCLLDGKEVHKTQFISKTLDPIWTVETGSLFLMTVDATDLFRGEGLLCVVKDYDKVGNNDYLGAITVPPKQIYDAKGERMEFKLGPVPGEMGEEDVPGHLALRIRRATDYDMEFMKTLDQPAGRLHLPGLNRDVPDASTKTQGGAGGIKSLVTRRSRMAKKGPNAGHRELRVRPGPDPTREEETEWMTEEQLQTEAYAPSKNWIDTGSGDLGRVHVEILGCDDLPNLDTGGFVGNKTDAFVSLVYEDAFSQTDIIDDTLSPRWMPWTKRAFIFHMLHSSSQLFLGVFDYDAGLNPTDDHDLVGRVSVDLSNLRRNTTYILKYNIYTTAQMSGRKRKGSITIRLRIEIDDERKLLLSTVNPPPQMYVNVKTRKEFRVVRYTCTGKYDMEKYSMKVINSYIEELLALQHVLFYIQDAAMTLFLWRGTLYLTKSIALPVHSLSAFLTAIYLVEHPQLVPSLFFLSIAWLLIASQSYSGRLPDIWSRCKTFSESMQALALGSARSGPDNIEPYHNHEAAQAFLDAWETRITDAEKAAAKAYEDQIQAQEELEKQMEEIGDTADGDLATKGGGGISVDPFKGILFPVQQNLGMLCRYIRHVKHVITWHECYISFWITAGCAMLSLICVFVPWFFLIRWTARLVVWTIFGPWMKLVDVFYVSKLKPLTAEEESKKKQLERAKRALQTQTAISDARVKREDKAKLKAMKQRMFGKFITRVPILKEDRYRDLPSPESHAEPYRPDPVPLSELAMRDAGYRKHRLPGQHLEGHMIPKVVTVGFTEAPVGQPTSNPELVDKNSPGGAVTTGTDSTAAAYIKLGSLVVVAAVLTWFGVPFLSSMTERALSYVKIPQMLPQVK